MSVMQTSKTQEVPFCHRLRTRRSPLRSSTLVVTLGVGSSAHGGVHRFWAFVERVCDSFDDWFVADSSFCETGLADGNEIVSHFVVAHDD